MQRGSGVLRSFVRQQQQQLRRYSTTNGGVKNIGFIGLGNMGSRMAPHLVRKASADEKTKLFVFDMNDKIVQQLVDENNGQIVGCGSVTEVAAQVDTLITMLPGPQQVKQVYEQLLPFINTESALFIDSSTIDPYSSQQVAELVQKKLSERSRFVDAPVSGGVNGAQQGTLTFMVGGVRADEPLYIERVHPLLSRMGKNIVPCGEKVGMGEVAKICNNLVLGISMSAVSEALVLGEKLGMDGKVLASIFNTSTARCWSSDSYNPLPGVMENVPASRNYEGGFACALMLKDLKLALTAADAVNQKLHFGEKCVEQYQAASDSSYAYKDFSAILQHFKNQTPQK